MAMRKTFCDIFKNLRNKQSLWIQLTNSYSGSQIPRVTQDDPEHTDHTHTVEGVQHSRCRPRVEYLAEIVNDGEAHQHLMARTCYI